MRLARTPSKTDLFGDAIGPHFEDLRWLDWGWRVPRSQRSTPLFGSARESGHPRGHDVWPSRRCVAARRLWSLPPQRYEAVLEVLEGAASVTDVARRYGVGRRTMHKW